MVLALEGGEGENNDDTIESVMPPYEEEKNWLMQIDFGSKNVDSGSFARVCLRDFAKQFPLTPAMEKFSALTADGRSIINYGERRVEFLLRSGQRVK
eukprot:5248210-Heterocapsa_arctica.AAC.1